MSAQHPTAMTFGSKEWNAYYHGRNKGHRAKGDKATRARTALKQSLTKKGERAELERRRAEFRAEGARLAKAQKAEDTAVSRILSNGARALKLSKPHGTFTPEDVQAFQRQGWTVHPTGTAPAKVGSSLAAKSRVELNPQDAMTRILGPKLQARAVILASPERITEDTLDAWRRAGYDVSAAPKSFRQGGTAKAKPKPKTQPNPAAIPPARPRVNPTPRAKGCQGAPRKGTAKKPRRQAESMPVSTSPARARLAHNPGPSAWEALERAWERWTGAKAGASLTLSVSDRGDCPKAVVMLGRVSELIAPTGAVKSFGESGPFMVTDGAMKRVWLLHAKGQRFAMDLTKGLIAYLAKKPKFGDRAPVKYVHAFEGQARAQMNGNTGELSGAFRLTPRGIEG